MNHGVSSISDADREQLNAYLDGELDASQIADLELRLSDDEALRAEYDQLAALDGALGRLPSSTVGPAFAESTIEIVAVTERDARKGVRGASFAAGLAIAVLVAAAGVGYLVASQGDDYDEQLARDLPLIERLEGYEQLEDVEFLRSLAEQGVFDDEGSSRGRRGRGRNDDGSREG